MIKENKMENNCIEKMMIYSLATLPILIVKDTGQIIFINDLVGKIFSNELTIGDNFYEKVGGEDEGLYIIQLIKTVITSGETIKRMLTFSGRVFSITASFWDDNGDTGCSLVFQDATELQQKKTENELLYQIALTMNYTLPINEILNKVIHQIVSAMKYDRASVFLLDKKSQTLQDVTQYSNTRPQANAFKIGEGIAGWVAKTGQPLAIPNTRKEKRYVIEEGRSGNDVSILCIPLISKNKLYGIINFHKPAGIYFSESEMQILLVISSRISAFLEVDRLKQWSDAKVKLAEILNSSLQLRPIINRSLILVQEILQVDNCALLLWRAHKGFFKIYLIEDEKNKNIDFVNINRSLTFDKFNLFVRDKITPIKLSQYKKATWVRELLEEIKWQDAYSYPVSIKGKYNGLLMVNHQNPKIIDPDEQNLAIDLSNQIALSLENADLYGSLQKEVSLLDSIQKTTNQGIVLLDGNGKIIYHNDAINKLFSIKKEIIKIPLFEILKSIETYSRLDFVFTKNFIANLQKRLSDDKEIKFILQTVGFPVKYLSIEIKNLSKQDSNKSGYLITVDDITQIQGLQETMSEKLDKLTQLFKISSISAKEFKETINKIIKYIPSLLQAESSLFIVIEDDGKDSFGRPIAQMNWNTEKWKSFIYDIRFNRHAKSLFIKNKYLNFPQDLADCRMKDHFLPKGLRNLLAVPVYLRGKIFGVVMVANKQRGRRFSQEDLRTLSIVVKQIESQWENVQLIEEIQAEKERVEMIINHASDGMILVNKQGQVVLWNGAMAKLVGVKAKEAIGDNIDQIIRTTSGKSIINLSNEKMNGEGEGSVLDLEILTKEGKSKWVELHSAKPTFYQGRFSGSVVMLFNDVSRYKELEQQKNEFISMTAHELRTPITAIKGYLSMIIRGDAGDLNDKQKLYFNRTFKSTERLVSLVEDILNVIRLEERRITYKPESMSIAGLAEEAVQDFQQKAFNQGVKVSLENILGREYKIFADPDRVKQIFNNLIDNAIKYTPKEGDVSVKLRKEKQGSNNHVIFEVADNGVGISEDQIEQVFNKFQRVNNILSSQAGGYGLGLYITRSLVEQQGGKIWVNSKLGHGSCFSVSFPIKK